MATYTMVGGPLFAAPFNRGRAATIARDLPPRGNGYLAGEYPGGTTTVEGAPQSATVRVLYRPTEGQLGDGVVVASTTSAPSGTWFVGGLDHTLHYDVVGRLDGYNDVIMSNVQPTRADVITYTNRLVPNEDFSGMDGYIHLDSGIPPFTATVTDALPSGIAPVVDGRKLMLDGTSVDNGIWEPVINVTTAQASNNIELFVVIGLKAPANLKAKYRSDP